MVSTRTARSRTWSRRRRNVRVPADEGEGVAALALPFVHAACDVVGAADFEEDGGFGLAGVAVSWVGASGGFCCVRELADYVRDASLAARVDFWGQQGACGGCVWGFVLLGCEPEDVDVAFFVIGIRGFAELDEEGGGCGWGDGWWD